MKKSLLIPSYAIIALMAGSASVVNCHAGFDYWDPQGTVGGLTGNTASLNGTWETSKWRTNAYSGNINLAWTENNACAPAYGGGPNCPAFTITMTASHTVGGFFNGPEGPDPCLCTISGTGTISIPANTLQGFHVNNDTGDPGQIAFNVPLAGTGTFGNGIVPEGSGSLYFNGVNTYSCGTYLGFSSDSWSGSLYITNANPSQPTICTSFGTGNIYISNSVGGAIIQQGTAAFTVTNAVANIDPSSFVASLNFNLAGNPAGLTFSGPFALSGATGSTPNVCHLNIMSAGAANDLVTISGIMSGTNGFTKGGPGILALSGVNTYTGNTIVSNGILALTNGGSINSVGLLAITAVGGVGGTFDVTGVDPYILSASTTLNATGVGTGQGITAAAINDSAPGGSISLNASQINLGFTPTVFTGDSTHPSLDIPNGALTLNNNQIVVTNAAATKLGVGTYNLIQVGDGTTGTVTGTPNPNVVVEGTGLAAGTVAVASVVNSEVVLTVSTAANATTTTISPTTAVNYGQTASFTATVSPVPDSGEVQFFVNGAPFGTPVAVNTGTGVATSPISTLPTLAAGTYSITATFSGSSDGTFSASTATAVNQVISKAPLTVTAGSPTTTYGTLATYTFSATLSNSETIGSVTYAVTGGTDPGTTNEYAGTYTLTPSAATGGSGTEANYTITYAAGTLTVNPKAATITASAESYTYGSTYTGLGTLKTTNFAQSGFVNGNNATNATVTLACTTNASAGTASAPVAGSPYGITPSSLTAITGHTSGTYTNFNVNNYTITYANGNLTENQLAVKLTGSQPYNGGNWIEANSLVVSNKVAGDTVYVAQGLGFTAVAEPPGVWPIASYGTLVIGNAGGQGTGTGSTLASDQFNAPASLALDASGNVYVADTANNRVCEVTPLGVQTVVPFTGLSNPVGVAVDLSSNIYVVCPDQNAVFEMPAGGSQTTAAISGLSYPTGIAVDTAGDVFVSDTLNNRVVELPVASTQVTVAGLTVTLPAGIAVDTNGDIFVVNSGFNNIVELPSGGSQTTLTGITNYSFPAALAVDNYTNVYLASYGSGNVRAYSLGSATPTLVTNPFVNLSQCEGVAVDASGDVFAADTAHNRLEELPYIGGTPGLIANADYGAVVYFGTSVSNNYIVSGVSGVITNTSTPAYSGLTNATITYGTASITLTGTLSAPGPTYPASGTTVTVTINGVSHNGTVSGSVGAFSVTYPTTSIPTNVYTITYVSAANGAFLSSTNTSTTLTVNPLPVTLTGSRAYDGANDAAASILTISDDLDGGNLTISGTGTLAGSTVGVQAITSFAGYTLNGSAAGNYTLVSATGSVTITNAAPVFSGLAASPSITYGTPTLTLSGTVSAAGPVYPANGETISVTIDGVTQTTPIADSFGDFTLNYSSSTIPVTGSPFTITYGYIGDSSFNGVTNSATALTVNPLAVTLTGTRGYDGTAIADFSILSVANSINGDVVNVASGSATLAGSGVGTEAITSVGTLALGGANAANYTLVSATGSVVITNSFSPFTITSAALDVTGTNLVVCWQSVPGVVYNVLTNTVMTTNGPAIWTATGSPVTASGTTTCFTLPGGIASSNVFIEIQQ